MFFNKQKSNNEIDKLIKVAALLIHAAKIDEDYTIQEEEIITKALLKFGATTNNVKKIIEDGKKVEKNSSQILEFTKEVKKMSEEKKIDIIETLWKIIYSNNSADDYESNLMRRLAGLLYIDNKMIGDIKEKIKKEIL